MKTKELAEAHDLLLQMSEHGIATLRYPSSWSDAQIEAEVQRIMLLLGELDCLVWITTARQTEGVVLTVQGGREIDGFDR